MENQQSKDQRMKFCGLVHFLPVLAFACFAAFTAVPLNAQATDQCGFDTNDDGNIDADDEDSLDVAFYEGDSTTTAQLPDFITTDCEQRTFVQLRIYEGFEVGEPNSNIKLPETGDLDLGPDSDPDSVTLEITGTHPDRLISLTGANVNWDSSSTAWLIAPIEYTVRGLTIGNDDLGSLKLTVIVLKGKLDPPTVVEAGAESPSNIYVKWDGLASSFAGADYQVEWVPSDGSGPAVLSDPIDDNEVENPRTQDYTISGLDANTAYNIRVRSYKKTSTNQYDFQVSDWVTSSTTENPITSLALYNETEGDSLTLTDGHTAQYMLSRWIVPSTLRPAETTYTVDVDSSNDAVFEAEHIFAGMGISDDIILITGEGEGEANLNIEVTTSDDHVLNATVKVSVGENAAPVFTVTSVTVHWDVENVGSDFEIDITNQFVSETIDEDDADDLVFSMTGGTYRGIEYLEIDSTTGDISVPSDVDDDDLNRLRSGHEFELLVTVTDPTDQSDNMTVYVEVIEGLADVPLRTVNSADDVWLTPLSAANNGGSKTTNVEDSFENLDGGQLCYEIEEKGFTVDGTDQTSNITINSNSIDVATVADFSLSGATSCPRGTLKVAMELPSTNSGSDQFDLLGYHGVITVWASVTAYQRGNKASASDDPVKVRIDLVYGTNSAPIIRSVAKATGSNTYYTTSAYSIDEGDDIDLTFTADDPSPTGDRLCWSQRGNCTPCKGDEDTEVYNAARGGVVTEKRASDTVSNISHEYELTVRGTEHGIFGSRVPKINTDYETNLGGYEINLCATDLSGATHKLKFVVKIENVEEAPVIVDIDNMYFLVGDYAQEIDLNDLTVDGDGETDIVDFDADIVGSSSAVTVEESNGIVTVTPTEDDVTGTQTVEIEVSATDSSGSTAYQSFFAYVKNTNTSPRFTGGLSALSYELEENSAVGTNVGTAIEATDPDEEDTVSYELSGDRGYFRVVTTDDGGQIKVKKKGLDYESDDNVFNMVLTASDNYGSAVALNVTVTLTDVNEPPMATPDPIPDQRVLVGVTECVVKASEHFTDPDADDDTPALQINASSTRPGEVSVDVENNEDVCITGESAGSTAARITIFATDSDGTTVVKRFRATAEQNNPPTVVGDGIPNLEVQFDGRSDDIDLNDYFNDGDAAYDEELSYEVSVDDTGVATAVLKDDHFLRIYGDEAGDTDITVTATDQNDQSITDTFNVEVVRNDPPIAHPDAVPDIETRLGLTVDPINVSGAFTDEGDTFELVTSTDDADIATTAIDYDDNDEPWLNVYLHSTGVTRGTLKATDTAGNTAEFSFSIDVGARNDPPKLVSEIDDVTVELDDRIDVELDDVFEDEGELTYEIDNEDEDVADVIYRSNSNSLRIWGNQVGTTDVTVTVYDNLDQTASDTFTVTVTDPPPTNSAPNLVAQLDDQTITVGMPGSVSIEGIFIDPDGDELAYVVESDDTEVATVTLQDMELNITGVAAGSTTVRVIASDPAGLDAFEVFKIYVETAPEVAAQIDDVTLQIGGESMAMNVDEYFVDEDGDELVYTFAFEGNAAIATFDGPSLSLAPSARGTTAVTVTATDTAGRSVSQSFNTIVSNSEIKAAGNEALASVGRQILSGVSNAIGSRVENNSSERNLFNRVIGGKKDKEDPAIAETSNTGTPAQTQAPKPTVKPVFDKSTTASAKTTSRDVFSKVVSPRNFRSVSLRDLIPQNFSRSLTGSNMRFDVSVWGTVDQQDVSGAQYATKSTSTFIGADLRPSDALMFGVSISQNDAESDYSWGTAQRQLQTNTTTILPYASYQVTPRTLVWGTVGIGSGDASVWNGDSLVDESDLSVRLGHLAFKSHLLHTQGIDLSMKGDVSVANLATDNGESEAQGLDTTVDRVRVGITGSYMIPFSQGGSISPFGELAYRRDGGDGATGSGIEFIGGVRVASKMFSLDARGHTMATYSEDDFEESGFSLLAMFNPTPGEEGFSLSFTPSWGQGARTETSLWQETATVGQLFRGNGLGVSQGMTYNTNITYGFHINRDQHMFKPFVEFGENSLDLRSIVFGAELKPLVMDSTMFNLNIILGRVDQLSKESNSHLGVNALLKF